MEGIEPDRLGPAMVAITVALLPASLGDPHRNPVRRPVAGALEACCVDEGLGQEHAVAPDVAPVGIESAQVGGEDLGGEVGHPDPRQDQKACVVDHPGQSLLAGGIIPAQEAVARRTAQGRGGPCEAGDDLALKIGGVAEMLADDRAVPEVVEAVDQDLPTEPLFAGDDANHERIKVSPLHRKRIDREGMLRERTVLTPVLASAGAGPRRRERKEALALQVPQQVQAGAELPVAPGIPPLPQRAELPGDRTAPLASVSLEDALDRLEIHRADLASSVPQKDRLVRARSFHAPPYGTSERTTPVLPPVRPPPRRWQSPG